MFPKMLTFVKKRENDKNKAKYQSSGDLKKQ